MVDTPRLDAARTRIIFAPEVAERLGRSEAQLRWMIQRGTAPRSAMIAGRRCWRESDVDAFIAAAFEEAN
ncbi:helix-turn-helix transcriptional regulator [Microbacterium xylanilyticum]